MAVLRRHGLSGDASARLWTISRTMRRDPRRRGLEYAAMVDVETGVPLGTVISGGEDAVDLRRHIRAFVRGHWYAQFHTHPGSSSFSDADVATLLSWEQIHAMVVVGVDGSWYALSRLGTTSATAINAAEAFLTEFDRLGEEHPGLPIRERTHRVWLTIADQTGLRYDRVQKDDP